MRSVIDNSDRREFGPLSTLIDGLQDGFYSLDAGWRFSEMNRAAEEYLRLDRKTVSGRASMTCCLRSPRVKSKRDFRSPHRL